MKHQGDRMEVLLLGVATAIRDQGKRDEKASDCSKIQTDDRSHEPRHSLKPNFHHRDRNFSPKKPSGRENNSSHYSEKPKSREAESSMSKSSADWKNANALPNSWSGRKF